MVESQIIHAKIAPLVVLRATTQHQLPVTAAQMSLVPFIINIMVRIHVTQRARVASSFLTLYLFYASSAALHASPALSQPRIVLIQIVQ
jgi:hypothetical protein